MRLRLRQRQFQVRRRHARLMTDLMHGRVHQVVDRRNAFQMRRLERRQNELALYVLAYNIIQAINMIDAKTPILAMAS